MGNQQINNGLTTQQTNGWEAPAASPSANPPHRKPSVAPPTLSVCMIVKNETHNLPDCLASLGDLPHEVIVVDTGSTDGTVEVARRLGAKVYHFTWRDDFAAARNESLRHATGEWIMWFDADFRLPPGQAEAIRATITAGQADAFLLNVRSPRTDSAVESWGALPMLFRNRAGVRFEGAVHEQVLPSLLALDMPPAVTNIVIEHLGYIDAEAVQASAARNLPLLEQAVAQNPTDPWARYFLAQTHRALGNHAAATELLQQLVAGADTPTHLQANAFSTLVTSLSQLGHHDEAVAQARVACARFPEEPFIHYVAGLAFAAADDFHAAVEALDRVLALPDPAPSPQWFFHVDRDRVATLHTQLSQEEGETQRQGEEETGGGGDREQRKPPPSPPLTSSPPDSQIQISACLIVRNEETTLPHCLDSIHNVAEEIVVVDTGSTDNTIQIAEQYGARLFHFRWHNDFAAARNESLRHATRDWILWLDADFKLRSGHQQRLRRAIDSDQADAYFVNVRSQLADGQVVEWGRLPMLFRNLSRIRFEGTVHEQVLPSLQRLGIEPVFSDIIFEHLGYVDPAVVRTKAARNLPALLQEIKRNPDDPFHNYHLGQAYVALERFPEALSAFERVLSSEYAPPHMRANAYAAALGVATGHLTDTTQAVRLAAAARREFPDYPFLRYMAGLAVASNCNWGKAIADFIHALGAMADVESPATPEAAAPPRGATQFRAVNPSEIRAVLESCQTVVAETFPEEQPIWRGENGGGKGEREKWKGENGEGKAEENAEQKIGNGRRKGELRVSLDRLAEGDVAPAERERALARIPELETEVERQPDSAPALAALGRTYATAGRYDDAVDILERALEINPALPSGYYSLGMCYQLQGDVLAALRAYERQVEIDPQHDRSWNNLGSLYGLHGNHEQALACFERAIALNPDDKSARDNLDLARSLLEAPSRVVHFGSDTMQHATRNTQHEPELSVCMIVKDEAHNLPDCLASLGDLPDEVIVVDTGSTDDTIEVAEKLGANVYHFPWCDDFAAARNESLCHATGDWILWFDADFRLAPGHADRIRQAITGDAADAYWLNVRSPFRTELDALNEWTRLLMLFRNHPEAHFEGAIHEQVKLGPQIQDSRVVYTDIVVHHLGYANPEADIVQAKARRNLSLLEKRLAEAPDDLHARFQYVQTLSFLKRHRDVLRETRSLLATPHLNRQAHYLSFVFRVQAWLGLDDYEAALADLAEGKKLFPNDRYLKYLAVKAHWEREEWQPVTQTLHQALECSAYQVDEVYTQEVSDACLHALLGEAYLYLSRLEQATAHFQQAEEAGWQSPDTAMRHGRALSLLGEHAAARNVLLRALKHAPAWIEMDALPEHMLTTLLEQLVEVCAALHDEETLLQVAQQAPQLVPESPVVQCVAASAYKQLDRVEEAIASYEAALALAPDLPEAYYGLGTTYLQAGRPAEAQTYLEHARTLAPDNLAVLNDLGYAYLWQGNVETAALAFGEAIQLKPDHARSYLNLGLALQRLDLTKDAQFCLDTALLLDPELQTQLPHLQSANQVA